MGERVFGAVDIGASGGRVIAGIVDGDRIRVDAIHRFPNAVEERDGHLRWNFTRLLDEVRIGTARMPEAESIGIDMWAVDYGLLDDGGQLLAEPIAYRDDRTDGVIDEVHALVPPEDLYRINGLQFLPFNTIYQLAAEQRENLWDQAAHVALLPDLLAYQLTGVLRTELTNASTTGLLDACTHRWSDELCRLVGAASSMLPALVAPGEIRGRTDAGTIVTTVGSHDTASAVVAVPATTDRFAYIASGTWSLVGVELQAPVLTEAARCSNFTNELGVDGRTRFLRNVGGLWLLQECLREWRRSDLDALLDKAADLPASNARIEVDDPIFIAPGDMTTRIATAAGSGPLDAPTTVRLILDSLADGYARTIEQATALSGAMVDVVHIVGGGCQNELLCQLTANATERPVLAGPVEATALGNILIQARAHGALPASLESLRERIALTTALRRYDPR